MIDIGRARLIALGLVAIAIPRLATAAVVVAETTGDATPAFLAELKESLETVAAEAPAELNAELRSSAMNNEAGLELVVEIVPSDGKEPIRETRVASRASALSQARAMGRAALRSLFEPKPVILPALQQTDVTPPVEFQPPLPESYSRRKALLMTVLPTILLPAASAVMFGLCFRIGNNENPDAWLTLISFGSTFATLGILGGPSVGYFYVGRWRHALAMMGLRLSLVGTSVAFIGIWISSGFKADSYNEQCEGTSESGNDCHQDSSPFGLVTAIVSATALLAITYTDAFLVGRAADHANAQWRERRKLEIQAAPVVWSNGHGNGTFGLALSGSF